MEQELDVGVAVLRNGIGISRQVTPGFIDCFCTTQEPVEHGLSSWSPAGQESELEAGDESPGSSATLIPGSASRSTARGFNPTWLY